MEMSSLQFNELPPNTKCLKVTMFDIFLLSKPIFVYCGKVLITAEYPWCQSDVS